MARQIAATLGDLTSIGPEVGFRAIEKFLSTHDTLEIYLFTSRAFFDAGAPRELRQTNRLSVIDTAPTVSGGTQPSKSSGERALMDLRAAALFCLERPGSVLVTGPVDKAFCALSQPDFSGQTGFLQKLAGTPSVTMILAHQKMVVALVTTHIPLKDVANKVTSSEIVRAGVHLRDFLRSQSRGESIAVCGLNPHAGDRGLLGDEEDKIIAPAIAALQSQGVQAAGPLSPDTAFFMGGYDGFVCMYHDQGLIPLKLTGFYEAVNISFGLPFLRVSVDHGTAFDLVGKDKASSLSYEMALNYAARWTQYQSTQSQKAN